MTLACYGALEIVGVIIIITITYLLTLMLLLAVFVYNPLTWIVSLFLAADLELERTAVGLFYHAGPTVWNSLPDELRNSDNFDSFKRFLKTVPSSRYSIVTSA